MGRPTDDQLVERDARRAGAAERGEQQDQEHQVGEALEVCRATTAIACARAAARRAARRSVGRVRARTSSPSPTRAAAPRRCVPVELSAGRPGRASRATPLDSSRTSVAPDSSTRSTSPVVSDDVADHDRARSRRCRDGSSATLRSSGAPTSRTRGGPSRLVRIHMADRRLAATATAPSSDQGDAGSGSAWATHARCRHPQRCGQAGDSQVQQCDQPAGRERLAGGARQDRGAPEPRLALVQPAEVQAAAKMASTTTKETTYSGMG